MRVWVVCVYLAGAGPWRCWHVGMVACMRDAGGCCEDLAIVGRVGLPDDAAALTLGTARLAMGEAKTVETSSATVRFCMQPGSMQLLPQVLHLPRHRFAGRVCSCLQPRS